jgi:hypothetical protein
LKAHAKSVPDVNDLKYSTFDFTALSNKYFVAHLSSVQRKIRYFKGDQYPYFVAKITQLKAHVKFVHDKIRDFNCSLKNYTAHGSSEKYMMLLKTQTLCARSMGQEKKT